MNVDPSPSTSLPIAALPYAAELRFFREIARTERDRAVLQAALLEMADIFQELLIRSASETAEVVPFPVPTPAAS